VFEVKMPQWGMNMAEGTIVRWLKRVGERVEKGEPLVEIEIAKATEMLESPVCGTVRKLVASEDETVPVQGILALIEE
jgi:pyruvate dehydrogenase E2 component (dihydrolipoamide acetyltransferase)